MLALCLAAVSAEYSPPKRPPAGIDPSRSPHTPPFVDGNLELRAGAVSPWRGASAAVFSPVADSTSGERLRIGELAQMDEPAALAALEAAERAWAGGQGAWPQSSLAERIEAIGRVVAGLKARRARIVEVLMWEIAKSAKDAAAEFDRTMDFISSTIETLREMDAASASWRVVSGVFAYVRRAAIGIMLALGPFNYPFNETYATLIPALLMGNVVIMKIPTIGGLAHVLTMEVYAKELPPGVINFISGSGRTTMPPIMRTGKVDILAFIGGSKAADALVKDHPAPHRLHSFMQLEGKNLGVVMADAPMDVAVAQSVVGSTSYNGQRCTAIKLILVHQSVAHEFVPKFVAAVAALKVGLPWEEGVQITPLPEPNKPAYLAELIEDALAKGAKLVNAREGGGTLAGALMTPAVLFPVTREMRAFHEEQFGPLIPIATYSTVEEVVDVVRASRFGQQAAIFTESAASAAPLVDALSTVVGRININTQCGRSPDVLPFSGRRSSALGTMSVSEALRTFSIETLVATKAAVPANEQVAQGLVEESRFMAPLPVSVHKQEL